MTRGHYIGEYVGELLDHAEGEQGANYTTIAGVAVCLVGILAVWKRCLECCRNKDVPLYAAATLHRIGTAEG